MVQCHVLAIQEKGLDGSVDCALNTILFLFLQLNQQLMSVERLLNLQTDYNDMIFILIGKPKYSFHTVLGH